MGNDLIFGGVNIIAVGDLYQLKPVMGQFIFEDYSRNYGPLATNLWTEYFKIYNLTEIMRQKDDKTFVQLLNRLRTGNHTQNDIKRLKHTKITNKHLQNKKSIPHFYPTLYLLLIPHSNKKTKVKKTALHEANWLPCYFLRFHFISDHFVSSVLHHLFCFKIILSLRYLGTLFHTLYDVSNLFLSQLKATFFVFDINTSIPDDIQSQSQSVTDKSRSLYAI